MYGAGEGCGGADRRRRRAGDEEPGRLPTPTRLFAYVWSPGQYPEERGPCGPVDRAAWYEASSDRFSRWRIHRRRCGCTTSSSTAPRRSTTRSAGGWRRPTGTRPDDPDGRGRDARIITGATASVTDSVAEAIAAAEASSGKTPTAVVAHPDVVASDPQGEGVHGWVVHGGPDRARSQLAAWGPAHLDPGHGCRDGVGDRGVRGHDLPPRSAVGAGGHQRGRPGSQHRDDGGGGTGRHGGHSSVVVDETHVVRDVAPGLYRAGSPRGSHGVRARVRILLLRDGARRVSTAPGQGPCPAGAVSPGRSGGRGRAGLPPRRCRSLPRAGTTVSRTGSSCRPADEPDGRRQSALFGLLMDLAAEVVQQLCGRTIRALDPRGHEFNRVPTTVRRCCDGQQWLSSGAASGVWAPGVGTDQAPVRVR